MPPLLPAPPPSFVHDMVTFSAVAPRHIMLHGAPSTECSWFAGYAWQICSCARCHRHLGWRYSWQAEGPAQRDGAAPGGSGGSEGGGGGGDGSGGGAPRQARRLVFWGLRRPAITVTDGRALSMRLAAEE